MPQFDPKDHLMKLKGKDYLPVAARLLWLNHEAKSYTINTDPVESNESYAIFKAIVVVTNEDGSERVATAHKREDKTHFPDFLEKAETGSIGRALGMLGYGTQFAPEFDESDTLPELPRGEPRVVDTPQKVTVSTPQKIEKTGSINPPVTKASSAVSEAPVARGNLVLESLEAKARYVLENLPEAGKSKSTTYPGAASIIAACKSGLYRRPSETNERLTAFELELQNIIKGSV